jgi:hypothetical protein
VALDGHGAADAWNPGYPRRDPNTLASTRPGNAVPASSPISILRLNGRAKDAAPPRIRFPRRELSERGLCYVSRGPAGGVAADSKAAENK